MGSLFLDQGLNSGPVCWKCGVLTTGPPGNAFFKCSNHIVCLKQLKHRSKVGKWSKLTPSREDADGKEGSHQYPVVHNASVSPLSPLRWPFSLTWLQDQSWSAGRRSTDWRRGGPLTHTWRWRWSRSVVSDSATPWTVAYQAPPSRGFSRQEYWSGLPFPSPDTHLHYHKNSETDVTGQQ